MNCKADANVRFPPVPDIGEAAAFDPKQTLATRSLRLS
jgi:hypothetical protein